MADNMRMAYGETLVALGARYPELVVLEADLCNSTMGVLFGRQYPDRFYDVGIAEANMVSIAAGLALTGKTPFVSSFAVFATGRCYDQIRAGVCIAGLNVKIAGSSAGLSDYGDGATHQAVEDIALMRALPKMQVFVPGDVPQTVQILHYMAAHPGPMYIRINRNPAPRLEPSPDTFTPGRVYRLRRGEQCALIACGTMVSRALEAAERLAEKGFEVGVYNAPSVKPLCSDSIRKIAACGRVVVAEEHAVIGGLADAVGAILEDLPVRMRRVGICDRFGQSAEDYESLMAAYGLTALRVEEAALSLLMD